MALKNMYIVFLKIYMQYVKYTKCALTALTEDTQFYINCNMDIYYYS